MLDANEWAALSDNVAATMRPYSSDLRELLTNAGPTDELTIGIGVLGGDRNAVMAPVRAQFPDVPMEGLRAASDDPALNAQIQDAVITAHMAAAARATRPVIDRATDLGMKIEYAGKLAPVFWATGTKGQIEVLSDEATVLTMSPSFGTNPSGDIARLTDQALYTDSQFWFGQGARVAVVEYGNVNWSVGNFSGANCKLSYTTDSFSYSAGHPMWVMGAIGGQNTNTSLHYYRGLAPEACLISVGTGGYSGPSQTQDFEILEAVDIAANPNGANADIINLSLVQDTSTGKAAMRDYIDEVVRLGVAVTAAAGNVNQCDGASTVPAPGSAWNVLTVGTIGDKNSVTWTGDDVGDHCYTDPPGGTFKPEISAPGQNVNWGGQPAPPPGGSYYTSIATPQVAGTFAQLIGIKPTEITASPIRMKAIVLAASHVHMVDAATQPLRLDDHEGIGSLTAKWSGVIASRQSSGGIKKGDFGKMIFTATGQNPQSGCWTRSTSPINKTFNVAVGNYVRVAAVWNSNGFYFEGSNGFDPTDFRGDVLDANFNIKVYKANGQLKTQSQQPTYNTEWVQFTAGSGTGEQPYRLEVTPAQWPCSSEQMSIAWAYVSWNQP